MTDRNRSAAIVAFYGLIAITIIPVFPHFISPNEFSRWLLAASVVEDGTIAVTRLAPMFGPRFEDLSESEGQLYSNKAPGPAVLGIPGYVAARLFAGEPSPRSLRASLTGMRIVAATLPLLLLAMVMTRAAAQSEQRDLPFGVFVLLFATPLFAYGLLMFAHAVSAAAIFCAWALLFAKTGPRPLHQFGAGALLGFATLSEYPLVIAALVFTVVLLWERRFGTVVRLILGGLPFAVALAIYNTAAFGGPLELSSGHERLEDFRGLASTGFFGIGLPSASVLTRMLVGPTKGLFVFSPVLLAGIVAFRSARTHLTRGAFAALVATPLAIVLLYSGYPNWHGGWGVGPRYISAAIPFLVFPLFLKRATLVEEILAGFSAFAVVMTTLVFPFVPNSFVLPWATFSLPLLAHGLVAPSLFHLLGRAAALIAPAVLIGGAMFMATRRRWTVAAGFALALGMSAALMSVRGVSLPERLQLAYVEEVYFERRGALARLRIPLPGRLIARRERELQLPPSPWPF